MMTPIRRCPISLISRMIIIKTLPEYSSLSQSLLHRNLLPPKQEGVPEYTMVLDLDETLVHCVMEPIAHYDRKFTVGFLASHDADRVQHGDS